MGEIIKHLIEFIKDKTTSWSFKTALVVSIFGLIFISDYYLGFSYNHHLNNKIGQIEKLSSLKKQYSADSTIILELNNIERKVFNKKHYSDRITYMLFNLSKNSDLIEVFEPRNQENFDSSIKDEKQLRSLFWMVLSSNYIFIIILPFIIFLPFYSKNGRRADTLVGWFASLIFIGIFVAIITWISYQIPLIWGNPNLNYILNLLIHTIIWVLIIKSSKNQT